MTPPDEPLSTLRELIRAGRATPRPLEEYERRAARIRRRRVATGTGLVLTLAGALLGASLATFAQSDHGRVPSIAISKHPSRHEGGGTPVSASLVSGTPALRGSPVPQGLQVVPGAAWVFTSDAVYRGATGAAWSAVLAPSGGSTIVAGNALDASSAWAVMMAGTPGSVTVQVTRTSDGGATWQTTTVPYTASPLSGDAASIDFFDAADGFLTLPTGLPSGAFPERELYASVDGGASWTAVSTTMVGEVYFLNASDGWGLPASGGPGLNETRDGGRTWTPVTLPSPTALPDGLTGAQGSPGLPAPSGAGSLVLPVAYTDGQSVDLALYESNDSGSTWAPTTPLADPGFDPSGDTLPLSMVSPSTWLTASSDSVYLTTDAGQSWRTMTTALAGASIVTLGFSTAEDGYLLTALQLCMPKVSSCTPSPIVHLLATSDGGATWSSVAPSG